MATRKPRKRAYIPPAAEVPTRSRRATTRTVTRKSSAAPGAARRAAPARERTYPEPSIRRTLKRLPVYFVLIFLLQYYLIGVENDGVEGTQRAIVSATQAAIVTVAFAPFMHLMDRWSYNRIQRRLGERGAAPAKR